jgi:hypothetical protein
MDFLCPNMYLRLRKHSMTQWDMSEMLAGDHPCGCDDATDSGEVEQEIIDGDGSDANSQAENIYIRGRSSIHGASWTDIITIGVSGRSFIAMLCFSANYYINQLD